MSVKVAVGWSGGKDSVFALYRVLESGDFEVVKLLTTLTKDYDRVSIHGVRRILLEKQAHALGLPLDEMFISKNASNEEYEETMVAFLSRYKALGVGSVVFGDIFLREVRAYREKLLFKVGMKGVFPLWGENTAALAHQFISEGFKAVVTSVDSTVLSMNYVGRSFDEQFLADLPESVDPCGENGEFHSFVYDGPLFREKVPFQKGQVVLRENRFYYCDLLPAET